MLEDITFKILRSDFYKQEQWTQNQNYYQTM